MKERYDLQVIVFGDSLIDTVKALRVKFGNSVRFEPKDVLSHVGIIYRVSTAYINIRCHDCVLQNLVN